MSELKVTEIACETAHEFVDYLRLSKEHWGDLSSSHSPWLFRGQANSEWPILPSLYRPANSSDPWMEDLKKDIIKRLKERVNSSRKFFMTDYAKILNQDSSIQLPQLFDCFTYNLFEQKLLHDFVFNADYNAFAIPEIDDLYLHDPINVDNENHFENYLAQAIPNKTNIDELEGYQQNELLAKSKFKVKAYIGLAQHHGISTRLIDMTYNPLTAAYFALNNFIPKNSLDEGKKIVVWGISSALFAPNQRRDFDTIPTGSRRFRSYQLYRLPRGQNAYLQRQEGIFIYPEHPYDFYFKNGYFPTFENYLQALFSENVPEFLAKKITLPYTQVYKLAKILDREGISKVKMMPTLDNVAESLKNRWKWEAWASKNSGSAG